MRRGLAIAVALAFLPALTGAQQVEYYHLDALGSVRAVTDASGEVLIRHDFEPFGEEWEGEESRDTRRFTGKERDDESGLDYFGARYYSGPIARFTTIDPVLTLGSNLSDPQRWNRYTYVRNNPVRLVDPTGEDWVDAYFYLTGFVNAFGSNFLVGLGRESFSEPNFVEGQYDGDLWAAGFGAVETASGLTATGGGVAVSTTGAGATVGVPAAVVGVGVAAHGALVTKTAAFHLSRAPKPGSAGGPGAGKRATSAQRREALGENDGRCVFCDEPATEADHSIPRSRDGDTTTGASGNLQPTCQHCNRQKGAKTSQEYVQWKQQKN